LSGDKKNVQVYILFRSWREFLKRFRGREKKRKASGHGRGRTPTIVYPLEGSL